MTPFELVEPTSLKEAIALIDPDDPEVRPIAGDFPTDVASALTALAAGDGVGYVSAVESVLGSFETRDEYLEDIPVADTVLVLQALAARRGLAAELASALLPTEK